jgi:hypothetical protein
MKLINNQVLLVLALTLAALPQLSAGQAPQGSQQLVAPSKSAIAVNDSLVMTLHQAASGSQGLGSLPPITGDAQAPPTLKPKNNIQIESSHRWRMFDPDSSKNSNDLWLDGELLLWKSNRRSLDYGVTSGSSTTIDYGHVKTPHFNWDWGFRLGVGYKLPHDKWDVFVNYTYVHGEAHGHSGGSDSVVFPVWASNFGATNPFFANSAKARWLMNLNMGDIELGRTCFVGKWLTLRPFLGVRGLVIDQNYHVGYKGGTVAAFDEDRLRMDTDFWGVGIRMGVNTLWGLGLGFGIYGNGSLSMLSGNFDIHEHEKLKRADVSIMNVKSDVDNVVVTADLALGLQWDYMFSKDRYHFGVKLGWEFDMFFDQGQLFNFIGSNPGKINFQKDDLSFQGLTLGFRFDF